MKDWLFGFLEDAGVAEVIYAEDAGVVTIDKRPRCPHCGGVLGYEAHEVRHCKDCERTYHRTCYWHHPCQEVRP